MFHDCVKQQTVWRYLWFFCRSLLSSRVLRWEKFHNCHFLLHQNQVSLVICTVNKLATWWGLIINWHMLLKCWVSLSFSAGGWLVFTGWQNYDNCSNVFVRKSFRRHQSSKLCEGLSIFLLVVLENFCQVWCPKIQRHVLRWRPLQEINFEKRKSPTWFWWLMPREWYNAVALLMRSSLIPDKFAQWNVGRFALLGRARLMIKKNWGKTIFIE